MKPCLAHLTLPFFAKVGLACETCLDPWYSGSDLSPSVVVVFQFAFCDSTYLCIALYSHLRLTDSHSRPRKSAKLINQRDARVLLRGVQILQSGSKYATVKFAPGVQLLRGSKFYVTGPFTKERPPPAFGPISNQSLSE